MQKVKFWQWIYSYMITLGSTLSWVIPTIIAIGISIGYVFYIRTFGWAAIIIGVLAIIGIYVSAFSFVKRKIDEIISLYETIESLLKQDMAKHSSELHSRSARMHPDAPMVNLSVYKDAITSIKTKGYIDFDGDKLGANFDQSQPIVLTCVTPGMFKFFMVVTQILGEDVKAPLLRIRESNIDGRDFTETWFNHIFPVLGNLTSTISEKMAGDLMVESTGEFYKINRYKLIQKGKEQRLRVYIA